MNKSDIRSRLCSARVRSRHYDIDKIKFSFFLCLNSIFYAHLSGKNHYNQNHNTFCLAKIEIYLKKKNERFIDILSSKIILK